MKERVIISDVAGKIYQALPKGILLNTQGKKINTMVIGWGELGRVWNRPTFTVYVRQSRYTKELLDASREFTVSIPLQDPDPMINRICGRLSGRDIDKIAETGLTLEASEIVSVPAIREYPLTLECKVLYSQDQEVDYIPEDIKRQLYPWVSTNTDTTIGRDAHTAYIGEIVDTYILSGY